MKNSFKISIDKYILRSTDDYFVMAEIVLAEDETPILQWYREEFGFTFKFVAKEPFALTEEEDKTFFNLFKILVDIIQAFMLEEGTSMKFSKELMDDLPMLAQMMKDAGIDPLEEILEEEVDLKDPLDYNEDEDDYRYDDLDDDTYFYGREDPLEEDDENYGHKDFED